MKLRYGSIIFVLAIFAAVMVAGCTFSKTFEIGTTTETPTPGGETGTATPTVPDATASPGGPSIDFDTIKVLEYRMSTNADGETTTMNMRWEFEPTLVHMKISMEGLPEPMVITVPRGETSSQEGSSMLSNAMEADFTTSLVSAGVDTVTVPMGTYVCTKYTVTDGGITSTYWIAPNVPLPIKMVQEQNGALMTSMELVDYEV